MLTATSRRKGQYATTVSECVHVDERVSGAPISPPFFFAGLSPCRKIDSSAEKRPARLARAVRGEDEQRPADLAKAPPAQKGGSAPAVPVPNLRARARVLQLHLQLVSECMCPLRERWDLWESSQSGTTSQRSRTALIASLQRASSVACSVARSPTKYLIDWMGVHQAHLRTVSQDER